MFPDLIQWNLLKKYERLNGWLCFLSWDENASQTSECITVILPACMFSEDHKKHLLNVTRHWSLQEGPRWTLHFISFLFLPVPSLPSYMCNQSWAELTGVGGWVAPLCYARGPMGVLHGISGVTAQGGEQRDGGLNGFLSSLLASQGNLFFLLAEFFSSSLGM